MKVVGNCEYDQKEKIGRGAFGKVYKGHYKIVVAIKKVDLGHNILKSNPGFIDREINILKKLSETKHMNIVTLFGCETSELPYVLAVNRVLIWITNTEMLTQRRQDDNMYFAMEYCNGGNLQEYLESKQKLEEPTLRLFLKQIADGLKVAHDRHIIHRDLKPANILLCLSGPRYPEPNKITLKIADFGIGRFLADDEVANTRCGSLQYTAPEIILWRNYKYKVDLWSIGVIAYECIVGSLPAGPPMAHQDFEIPTNVSADCASLLKGLLEKDETNRFDIEQLCDHQFLADKSMKTVKASSKPMKKGRLPSNATQTEILQKQVEADEIYSESIKQDDDLDNIENEPMEGDKMSVETMETDKKTEQLEAEKMSSKPMEEDTESMKKNDDIVDDIEHKCTGCDCCKESPEDETTQFPTASKHCLEGKMSLCSQCFMDHRRQKLLQGHQIVDIPCQAEKNVVKLSQSNVKTTADISQHFDSAYASSACLPHAQNKTNETEVMIQIKRERDRLAVYEAEMSICVNELLEGQEDIDIKENDITKKINKRHSEFLARLEREKKSLLDQLESGKMKQLTENKIKSNEALDYLLNIGDRITYLDEFLSKGSVAESDELTQNSLLIHVYYQQPIPSLTNVSFHESSSYNEAGTRLIGRLEGLNTENMQTRPTLKNYLDFLKDVHSRTTDAMKISWHVIILNEVERKNRFGMENLHRVYEELDLIGFRDYEKVKELQKTHLRLLNLLCAITRQSSEAFSDKQNRPFSITECQSTIIKLWNTIQFQLHYKNSEKGLIPEGFQNHGYTCYFNSVLQCLLQTVLLSFELTAKLYSLENVLTEKKEMSCLRKAFLELSSKYKQPDQRKEALKTLYHMFKKTTPRFNDERQHDSYDLLIHFLDKLRVEERSNWEVPETKKLLTAVDRIFGGQFITAYTCHSCQEPYANRKPFLDISIPLSALIPDEQKPSKSKGKSRTTFQSVSLQAPSFWHGASKEALETSFSESQKNPTDDHRSCTETVLSSSPANGERKDAIRNMLQPIAVEVAAEPEAKNFLSRFLSKTPNRPTTISQCLQYLTRAETISDEYLCRNCQTPDTINALTITSATKRTLISSPPSILVLHLKRFEEKSTEFVKRDEMISYDELLDIGSFCSVSALRIDPEEENVWYSLYAVVVHSGHDLSQGHYVAYVKKRDASAQIEGQRRERFLQKNSGDRHIIPSEDELVAMKNREKTTKKRERSKRPTPIPGQWFYISDETVRPCDAREALDQKAYLLFYERIPGI